MRLSANQDHFKAELRHSHAVCTLWVHPFTLLLSHPFLIHKPHLPRILLEVGSLASKSHNKFFQSLVVKGLRLHACTLHFVRHRRKRGREEGGRITWLLGCCTASVWRYLCLQASLNPTPRLAIGLCTLLAVNLARSQTSLRGF